MLVELHCHSHHSEGTRVKVEGMNSPSEIVEHAKRIGIGAVAITDHDVFKACGEAKAAAKKHGIIYIPAEEVYTSEGHMLAIGINEWVKPHRNFMETIDAIHSQGGIAVSPHAFDIYNKGMKDNARFCDAMEIFNCLNLDRLANFKGRRFSRAFNVPGVAGSDAHTLSMMGHGLNEIGAWDAESILKSIRKGRVSVATRKYIPISIIRQWSLLRLQHSYDFILDYIEKNYAWPKSAVSRKLLNLARGYPGSAENMFRLISYASLAAAITYSSIKTPLTDFR